MTVEEPEQPAEDPEASSSGSQPATLQAASEPWLISVGGKLLEPAPADSGAIEVTGLTALSPKAGTMLEIPEAEQPRLDALLNLLATLEEMEAVDRVSSIQLSDTQVKLHYLERFEVKMPLNADFSYKLRGAGAGGGQGGGGVWQSGIRRHGPDTAGLRRGVFSPIDGKYWKMTESFVGSEIFS